MRQGAFCLRPQAGLCRKESAHAALPLADDLGTDRRASQGPASVEIT
jgi:hypothetical protein